MQLPPVTPYRMTLTEHSKHVIIACLVAVVLLAGVHFGHKIVAHYDGVAHDQRVLADEALKIQQDKNKTDAAASVEIAKTQAKRDAVDAAERKRVESENTKLRSDLADAKLRLADQQTKDKALQPVELANRVAALAGVSASDVKVTPDGFEFSLPATQNVVQLLDELFSDRATIASQQKIIDNDESRIATANDSISGLHEQVGQLNERITGLKSELNKMGEDWNKQKKDDRRQARKRSFKWFVSGAATGAVVVIKLVMF